MSVVSLSVDFLFGFFQLNSPHNDSSFVGTIFRGNANLRHHHKIGKRIEIQLDKFTRFAFDAFVAWCFSVDYSIADLGNNE